MKKLIVMLLALMLCLPAWAETVQEPMAENVLAPFVLQAPEGVMLEENAGGTSCTYIHPNGTTRVVAMVLGRVPDEQGDHAAELRRLMAQFAPGAPEGAPLTLTAGFHGLKTVVPEALSGAGGLRIDQVNVMVLWQTTLQGELLILSGYDMLGDTQAAEMLIDALLTSTTVNQAPVVPQGNPGLTQ